MTITSAIAIYAAAVATAAFLWQLYTWWDRRRTKVEVRLFDDYEDPGLMLVVVQVTNHTNHEVSVNGVTLKGGDDHGFTGFPWSVRWDGRNLPAPIPPHQQLELACSAEDVAMTVNTSKPVVARVRLGDNQIRYSRPTKIDPRF